MRFQLAGFPVEVHPSFLIMSVLLGLGRSDLGLILLWVAVVLLSVLVHELGHAYAGRAFGMYPTILLYSMGGLTSWRTDRSLSPGQSIVVSLAGPGAGLLLGSLVWGLSSAGVVELTGLGQIAIEDLLWVNVAWSIINLLPLLPLDGGNVMRTIVHVVRRRRDDRLPRQISMAVGGLAFVAALFYRMTWSALLAALFAYSNYAALKGTSGPMFPGAPRRS